MLYIGLPLTPFALRQLSGINTLRAGFGAHVSKETSGAHVSKEMSGAHVSKETSEAHVSKEKSVQNCVIFLANTTSRGHRYSPKALNCSQTLLRALVVAGNVGSRQFVSLDYATSVR